MIVTLKPINIGALADWDTGNVTDMSSMFDGCSSLTDLNALINWDTSAVNNMKAMFNGEYSGWFYISCPVIWKSLFRFAFVYIES